MDFEQILLELGLGEYVSKILPQKRDCVWLTFGETFNGEKMKSRIGGLPELPNDVEWPRTIDGEIMEFAMQINLTDLPQGYEWPLPSKGMLYFFMGLDEPATDIEHKLLLLQGGDFKLRERPNGEMIGETFEHFESHILALTAAADFPRWASDDNQDITTEMEDELCDIYNEDFMFQLEPKNSSKIVGKIFGHIKTIGQDSREDAEIVKNHNPDLLYNYSARNKLDLSNYKNWHPLLTIDSNNSLDLCIWDAGFINILVEEQQMKAQNFSNAYVAVETS